MYNCALYIDDIDQLKKIFHSNLKELEYDVNSVVKISNNGDNSNSILYIPDLEFDATDLEISIVVGNSSCWNQMNSLFSKIIKQLRLQGKVQCFKISFLRQKEHRKGMTPIFLYIFNAAKYVHINEKIMIIIHEQETLYTFAEILILLNKNRLKILDSTINNVQTIVFEFCLSNVYKKIKPGAWRASMWRYQSDREYPVDSNKIECKNCHLETKELGVLYQNIIKWFQNIHKRYGNDKLKQTFYLHLTLNKI